MSRIRPHRLVAAGAGLAAMAGLVVLGAHVSQATAAGTLAFAPTTGADTSSVVVTTSGPCTDPNATNLQAKVFGSGFPAGGQVVVSNSPISAYTVAPSGGYDVPLAQTMRDFANQQATPATLAGKYDFVLTCRTNVNSTSLGDFTGSLWFTSNTAYQSTDPTPSEPPLPAPQWRPALFGTVRVGGRPACVASFDYATTVSYEWFRDGVTIPGATAGTYLVPDSAYQHKLKCKVTGSNNAGSLTGTSSEATVGVGAALKPTKAPYLYGTVRAGSRVYCKTGTWSPAATSYTYRWKRGSTMTSVTSSSFVPPSSWRGYYLSCVVTAKRIAWTNGVATSKAVKIA